MTALDGTTAGARATSPASPRRRRAGAWILIGIALLLIGTVGGILAEAGRWADRQAFDPESAGPLGTRALVEILRDQGVEVVVARDRAAATAALEGAGAATLVLPDAPALSDAGVRGITRAATDVVLVDPRARTLDLLLSGAEPAGVSAADVVEPACDLAEARRSGAVSAGAVFSPGGDEVACYPSGAAFGLIVGEHGGQRVAALDGRALVVNEHLAENGNAALALNLTGRHPVVVWYVPSLADTDLTSDPSLGELTPEWVTPVMVLLVAAAVAAGIWRGRRFGPLVVERLPVTVRVSETTEGRARLYARSRDALHAADRLRIGALRRLARTLGLGPSASAIEISDAAAERLGWDPTVVRGILIDELPTTDAQLVDLHDRLRTLERAVRAVVRPPAGPAR
jgi:hypothetical protein